MKTIQLFLGTIVAFSVSLSSPCPAVDLQVSLPTPRLQSLTASPTNGLPSYPDLFLQFSYDKSGKILFGPGSRIDTNPVSGAITLVKKTSRAGTVFGYTITAKGTATKGLTASLKGELDSGRAYYTSKQTAHPGPNESSVSKALCTNLPVVLSKVMPVTAQASFSPVVSAKGKITGTGTIVSGYGNETTNTAVLKGQLTKNKLTLQLLQGKQLLSFTGTGGSTGFLGTLTVTLPPAKATLKNFAFPALPSTNGGTGVLTTFRGKVSQVASQGSMPIGAVDATVTVGSDLNGNGTIEASEQSSVQTDGNGNYSLSCRVTNGGKAVLQFSLPGHAKQIKVVAPVQGGATVQNNVTLRELVEMTLSGTTATSSDGKLELQNLPANIASLKGRAFNPVTEADQFPGEFADDQKNLLVSSAFAAIEATDSTGNAVHQLNSTSTVRILIPQDTWNTLRDLSSGNGQIDVPLYYFDEPTGTWKRSSSDGWLEDASGAKVAESQLASLKDGTYAGSVYAVGPVTHLSYWNCDWPIDTHTCVHAAVVDTNGAPVVGASVSVKGVTYNGTTSPKITGPDGTFCAEVMRSEQANEDLNDNGVTGETQSVAITVFTGTNYYNFGPFAMPTTQATCEQGNCLEVGPLVLSETNQLSVSLCNVTGTVVLGGTNHQPVARAVVYGWDDNLDAALVWQYMTNGAGFYGTADTNGQFSLNVPLLTGLTLWTWTSTTPPDTTHTYQYAYGTLTLSGCPTGPVTLETDWWRGYGMLGAALTQGSGYLYQYPGLLYCGFMVGTTYYWGMVPDGVTANVPTQPGQTLTLDLYQSLPAYSKVGTITFTATTAWGGTWSTTGVSLSGTWGN